MEEYKHRQNADLMDKEQIIKELIIVVLRFRMIE